MTTCTRCLKPSSIIRYIDDKAVCPECHTEDELKHLRFALEEIGLTLTIPQNKEIH